MGLETGTLISDLVATNPIGSDLSSTVDDHIRLVKTCVKTTFPNITAAVTVTAAQLNAVATNVAANPSGTIGLTAVNGSASTYLRSDGTHALSQSIVPTWTGAHIWSAAATFNGTATFNGAVVLTSTGTIGGVSFRDATNLFNTGNLPDTRLSANVALLNGGQNFTGTAPTIGSSRVNTVANTGRSAFGFVTGTSGALSRSLNVTSAVRNATGNYTINVTAAGFGATPICNATIATNAGGGSEIVATPSSATSVTVITQTPGGAAIDSDFSFECKGT